MSAAEPPSAPRQAPIALWRVAQAFMQTLHVLFGAPEDVARRHTLTGTAHAFMAGWLRAAEAMLRRLILIEAAAFPKPNTRPLLTPRHKRTRKLMLFTPEAPERWRVSFRLFASGPRARAHKKPGGAATARLERLLALGAKPGEPVFIFREERAPAARQHRSRHTQRAARKPIRRQDRFWVHERDLKPLVFRSAWPLAERYEALLRAFNDPHAYAARAARRLHAVPHRLCEPLKASQDAADRVDRFEAFSDDAEAAWRTRLSSA